ncbi:MAG: hypothetical protein ACREPM_12830 [Gemmatimonadaceae bacterium]
MPTEAILALRRQLAAAIDHALGPGAPQVISRAFGIPQPRMSELSRGIVDRCTVEWLIRRVHAMGGSATLTIELGDVGRAWRRERFQRMRICGRNAGAGPGPAAAGSRVDPGGLRADPGVDHGRGFTAAER